MQSKFSAILLSLLFTGPLYAEEASMFDYRLGDHIIDYPLDELDVISSDLDGFRGQSFIKVRAPEETEVVLTFREPRLTLQYLEHDWIDRDTNATTALALPDIPEFVFGETRLSDIQAAFGEPGFHYSCRKIETVPGGFISFISFKTPKRPEAVYTFAVEFSRNLAQRGLVDLNNVDLKNAVLVGTMVSRPDYPEDFWCAETEPYSDSLEVLQIPEIMTFEDFLPHNVKIADNSTWEVETDPILMITKNGAITWGDRLYITPIPQNCTRNEFMVWAHSFDDTSLLALEGKDVNASFNLLLSNGVRVPLEAPVKLSHVLFAPINGREWPPFALGSFVFGTFDFEHIMLTETNPSVVGFSFEFHDGTAGMHNNYWSLEGLEQAGNEAIRKCEELNQ